MDKKSLEGKILISAIVALFVVLIAYPAIKNRMFVMFPNVVLLIAVVLVGATIGFIIYGCIKGFENTFPKWGLRRLTI